MLQWGAALGWSASSGRTSPAVRVSRNPPAAGDLSRLLDRMRVARAANDADDPVGYEQRY